MGDKKTGEALRKRAQGSKADRLQEKLTALDPKLAEWADSFVFGEVWVGDSLDFESQMLVAITALAAQERSTQLRNYLFGALEAHMPVSRIREALTMLTVYAGFPVAVSALACLDEVAASLERHGVALNVEV